MAWSKRAIIATLLVGAVWSAGCARCGEDPTSTELPGSKPLPFEGIELGISRAAFTEAAAPLGGLSMEDASRLLECGVQTTLMVIDPGAATVEERAAGSHRLENCTLLQAGAGRSADIVSVRGEFVDGALASVTIEHGKSAHQRLVGQLTARYGQPVRKALEERSILGTESREHLLWLVRDATWALDQGGQTTRLVHQSRSRCEGLPRLPEPAKRPEPVDLSDIGLGGGLDLKAPLPTIDAGLLVGGDR